MTYWLEAYHFPPRYSLIDEYLHFFGHSLHLAAVAALTNVFWVDGLSSTVTTRANDLLLGYHGSEVLGFNLDSWAVTGSTGGHIGASFTPARRAYLVLVEFYLLGGSSLHIFEGDLHLHLDGLHFLHLSPLAARSTTSPSKHVKEVSKVLRTCSAPKPSSLSSMLSTLLSGICPVHIISLPLGIILQNLEVVRGQELESLHRRRRWSCGRLPGLLLYLDGFSGPTSYKLSWYQS